MYLFNCKSTDRRSMVSPLIWSEGPNLHNQFWQILFFFLILRCETKGSLIQPKGDYINNSKYRRLISKALAVTEVCFFFKSSCVISFSLQIWTVTTVKELQFVQWELNVPTQLFQWCSIFYSFTHQNSLTILKSLSSQPAIFIQPAKAVQTRLDFILSIMRYTEVLRF